MMRKKVKKGPKKPTKHDKAKKRKNIEQKISNREKQKQVRNKDRIKETLKLEAKKCGKRRRQKNEKA